MNLVGAGRVMAKGRAAQGTRPGLIVKGILQGQIPLVNGCFVTEASVDDLYAAYVTAAQNEKLVHPIGERVYRKVMSYASFKTLFRFGQLLKLVEPAQDGTFKITEVGCGTQQEWEDLRRTWQILARGKKVTLKVTLKTTPKTSPKANISVFTHEGAVWLCQEYMLKHGLLLASGVEIGWLSISGFPDLLFENRQGTKLYVIEVKHGGAQRYEALAGIGQCASYRCGIPNASPCLVIPGSLSAWVSTVCNKLSFNWMSVIAFDDNGEFSLVYGEDSFIRNMYSI